MNRRGFIKLLLPAVGAVAVAPELIAEIWTPRRTIFLPPPGGWSLVWRDKTLGGYFYSQKLSNVLRMNVQPLVRFRQGGLVVPEKFTWDVYSDFTVGSHHALGTKRR